MAAGQGKVRTWCRDYRRGVWIQYRPVVLRTDLLGRYLLSAINRPFWEKHA